MNHKVILIGRHSIQLIIYNNELTMKNFVLYILQQSSQLKYRGIKWNPYRGLAWTIFHWLKPNKYF